MLGTVATSVAERASGDKWPAHLLRLIDVGGAGGVQSKWLSFADRIIPVLFEPNPLEAAKLRGALQATFTAPLVIESALSNVAEVRNLHVARYWGCTSIREPNFDVLSKYRIGPAFDVVNTMPVACSRYDTLHVAGLVPSPDAIKIDVQGFEHEVLEGFGGCLQDCLGIELEAHFYPIYRGQKLFCALVDFLSDFGFVLRKLSPVPSFDGDVVEIDAWFTKDIRSWQEFTEIQREKFSLICKVWDLVNYSRIDQTKHHNDLLPE